MLRSRRLIPSRFIRNEGNCCDGKRADTMGGRHRVFLIANVIPGVFGGYLGWLNFNTGKVANDGRCVAYAAVHCIV